MIPFILYASFWTGALVLGGNIGDLRPGQMNFDVIQNNVVQYTVGAVVLAVVAAIVVGLLSYLILKYRRRGVV